MKKVWTPIMMLLIMMAMTGKKSRLLEQLPLGLRSTLKINRSATISDEMAEKLMKLRRFDYVSRTEPQQNSMRLCE